jgi:hypothetical protein
MSPDRVGHSKSAIFTIAFYAQREIWKEKSTATLDVWLILHWVTEVAKVEFHYTSSYRIQFQELDVLLPKVIFSFRRTRTFRPSLFTTISGTPI